MSAAGGRAVRPAPDTRRRRRSAGLLALALAAACAPAAPPVVAAGPAPPAPLADACAGLVAQAEASPSLQVDRAPDVVAYDPPPLRPPYPRGVLRRDGTTRVQVSVVVDTLGTPRMDTFTVIEATHPWLAQDIKAKLPKWKFTPAIRQGCLVPALWVFTATPGRRTR